MQLPSPKPQPIFLTQRQQSVLEKIARRQTSSVQLVRRVQIILRSAQGKNNQQVARDMGIHRETVSQWRERWLGAAERLSTVEETADDKQLVQLIESGNR